MVTTLTVLKSVHVLAAALWVGGAFALNVAVTLAIRSADPSQRIATLRLATFLGPWAFTPLAVVVLASGHWLTAEYYDFSELWISLGLAGVIVALAALLLYIVPRSRSMLVALERGDPVPANYVPTVARLTLLLLSAIVVIMVIRPG